MRRPQIQSVILLLLYQGTIIAIVFTLLMVDKLILASAYINRIIFDQKDFVCVCVGGASLVLQIVPDRHLLRFLFILLLV